MKKAARVTFRIPLLLALGLGACRHLPEGSEVRSAGNDSGNLRGYVAIEKQLKQDLLVGQSQASFTLAAMAPGLSSLQTYLGAVDAQSGEFRNFKPNGLNMLLWDVVLTKVAVRIGGLCASPSASIQGAVFTPDAVKAVTDACQLTPEAATADQAVLPSFWSLLMGFEAPDAELDAWRAYFYGPGAHQYADAGTRVSAMARYIFLNPHFLLEK